MLISELCLELEKIKEKYGDIKVEVPSSLEEDNAEFFLIETVEAVVVCKGEKRVWLY
jgi:hypothetical protein